MKLSSGITRTNDRSHRSKADILRHIGIPPPPPQQQSASLPETLRTKEATICPNETSLRTLTWSKREDEDNHEGDESHAVFGCAAEGPHLTGLQNGTLQKANQSVQSEEQNQSSASGGRTQKEPQ